MIGGIADTLPRPPWLEAGAFVDRPHIDPDGNRRSHIHRSASDAARSCRCCAPSQQRQASAPIIAIPGIAGYIYIGLGRAGSAADVARLRQSRRLPDRAARASSSRPMVCRVAHGISKRNARTRVCNLHFDCVVARFLWTTFGVSRASPNGFAQRPPNVEEIP